MLIHEPKVIRDDQIIEGTKYIKTHDFEDGSKVPIYEVSTINGLNQIIGYVKFINRYYGRVYSRGEAHLHPSLKPSAARISDNGNKFNSTLSKLRKAIREDNALSNELKLDKSRFDNIVIEATLQHYGVSTYCVDAVDNHWVALWFGQNLFEQQRKANHIYARYTRRYLPIQISPATYGGKPENEVYQYLLLIAADGDNYNIHGITRGADVDAIDLRRALPSIFLRPHAQHGVILRKRQKDRKAMDWDLASNVVCILRMRIDVVSEWIGRGAMLTQKALVPSPMDDKGYMALLTRTDIFNTPESLITEYVY